MIVRVGLTKSKLYRYVNLLIVQDKNFAKSNDFKDLPADDNDDYGEVFNITMELYILYYIMWVKHYCV